MLHDEEVPIPPSLRSEIERRIVDVDIRANKLSRFLLRLKIGFTVVLVALLVAMSTKYPLWEGPGLGASIVCASFAFLFWFWPHHKDSGNYPPEFEKEQLRKRLERGTILKRRLTMTDDQVWIEHEHGHMLLVPADQRRTLFVDVSSVAVGDARYPMYEDGTLFRREWSWYQFPGEEHLSHEFTTSGEKFEPVRLHTNEALELFELFGSPGDGDVLDRPWPEVRSAIRAKVGS